MSSKITEGRRASFSGIHNWRRMIILARTARENKMLVFYASIIVIGVNILGTLDVIFLHVLLQASVPTMVNPFLDGMVQLFPAIWIYVALSLQLMTSISILWYPHPFFLVLVGARVFVTLTVLIHNIGLIYVI